MFVCNNCDSQFNKWLGQCPECQKWGTINEINRDNDHQIELKAHSLNAIKTNNKNNYIKTGFKELDNTLGGGLMSGSIILLGGEPGIGKSTIALQIAKNIKDKKILYCAGEESPAQIKLRADRLKINNNNIYIISETDIDKITKYCQKEKIDILIIDSIHTAFSSAHQAEAGSVTQIRLVAQTILNKLKENNTTSILIGQITKDGSIAGPKTLEHLVDTVVYMEKEQQYRLIRVTKNRFGNTNHISIFKMSKEGLQSIDNFNNQLLNHMNISAPLPGTAFSLIGDNNKNIICEIQCLVNKTIFGYPQRKTVGFDNSKLQILSAVLAKYTKINLGNFDIHINLASGLRTKDPGIDLAVVCAIISSFLNKKIKNNTIILGEVGLAGTVKPVKNIDEKIKEAKQLGFTTIIANYNKTLSNTEIITVKNISDIEKYFNEN